MTPCSCGSTNVIAYPHRPDAPRGKDKSVCFNGIEKTAHICVAECAHLGMFCGRCRQVRSTGIRLHKGIEMGG
jgi:hypothetical protein